jgi:hypothetical protein
MLLYFASLLGGFMLLYFASLLGGLVVDGLRPFALRPSGGLGAPLGITHKLPNRVAPSTRSLLQSI